MENNKPSLDKVDDEVSSEPSYVLASFLGWLRGFHSDREKSKAADWAMVVLTFLTLAVAILSAFYFQGQLAESRRSTDAGIENFKLDERAWIEIESINLARVEPHVKERPSSYRYEIRAKNVGKTVASNVLMTLGTDSSKDPVGYDEKKILQAIESLGAVAVLWEAAGKVSTSLQSSIPRILAPNTNAPVPAVIEASAPSPASSGFKPNDNEYDYIIGAFYYDDVFQAHHSLSFCYIVADNQGNLRTCFYGNDEDRLKVKAR